jgi:hypothetical protein
VLAWFACSRLGFGQPFPSQPDFEKSSPLLDESRLQVVAELEVPPGNLAISKKGRVLFNFHPEVRSNSRANREHMSGMHQAGKWPEWISPNAYIQSKEVDDIFCQPDFEQSMCV